MPAAPSGGLACPWAWQGPGGCRLGPCRAQNSRTAGLVCTTAGPGHTHRSQHPLGASPQTLMLLLVEQGDSTFGVALAQRRALLLEWDVCLPHCLPSSAEEQPAQEGRVTRGGEGSLLRVFLPGSILQHPEYLWILTFLPPKQLCTLWSWVRQMHGGSSSALSLLFLNHLTHTYSLVFSILPKACGAFWGNSLVINVVQSAGRRSCHEFFLALM